MRRPRSCFISEQLHSAIVFLRKRLQRSIGPHPMKGARTHKVSGYGIYRSRDLLTWARDLGWDG